MYQLRPADVKIIQEAVSPFVGPNGLPLSLVNVAAATSTRRIIRRCRNCRGRSANVHRFGVRETVKGYIASNFQL
ncbi:MAG: hypothetical protein AAB935_00370, partial [Patescibacteria group bacterium]